MAIPLQCLHQTFPGNESYQWRFFRFRCPLVDTPQLNQFLEYESYVTIDGQSASLSWCQGPNWCLRPNFYYCQTVAGLCRAPSLTRGRVCPLQLLLALSSAVIFGSQSRGTRWLYFTVSDSIFPFSSPPTTHRATPPSHGILTRCESSSVPCSADFQNNSSAWTKQKTESLLL
jgi:hypothetical protein